VLTCKFRDLDDTTIQVLGLKNRNSRAGDPDDIVIQVWGPIKSRFES